MEVESLANSLELHIDQLEDMLPKMRGLLTIPLEQRLIELSDAEIEEGLEDINTTLGHKQILLETLMDKLTPQTIPVAKFHE